MNKSLNQSRFIIPTENCWDEQARPNQKPPPGDWNIWLLLAGRGFGKTRTAAETIRRWVLDGQCKRIAIIGCTIKEAQQVMVEGASGLLSISPAEDKLEYIPSRRILRWGNGAIAQIYGAENYEQLRGPQFDAAWVDEFAKFMYPRETFEQISFSMRLGDHPRAIITTTPRPIPFLCDLMRREDVVVTRGTSLENIENLSKNFRQQLEFLKGSRLEAQEIYGEIVEDRDDTLWRWSDIENCYRLAPRFLENVVIGVDPALTTGGDETGIIVAGMDDDGKAYVLADLSCKSSPSQWAKAVVQAYYRYNAKVVVIEANAGGDLLTTLLLQEDSSIKVKKVHARSSKIDRAEPIAILYQKQKIFHAQQFQKLEMQMATYTKDASKSPDRMDALVWAMTELFALRNTRPVIFGGEAEEDLSHLEKYIPIWL